MNKNNANKDVLERILNNITKKDVPGVTSMVELDENGNPKATFKNDEVSSLLVNPYLLQSIVEHKCETEIINHRSSTVKASCCI
jgi:hypothetical protein